MFQTKQMLCLSTQIILLIFEFSDMRVVLELGNFLASNLCPKEDSIQNNSTSHEMKKW
jgi:hypothetical protein